MTTRSKRTLNVIMDSLNRRKIQQFVGEHRRCFATNTGTVRKRKHKTKSKQSASDKVMGIILFSCLHTAYPLNYAHMMTLSNGNFFTLLALYAGNSPVTGEFPSQRPVRRSFDALFDVRLNKGWVNTRDAGDLRRHRSHYDVAAILRKSIIVLLFNQAFSDMVWFISQCGLLDH